MDKCTVFCEECRDDVEYTMKGNLIAWKNPKKEIPSKTGDYLVICASITHANYVFVDMIIDRFVNENIENLLYNRMFASQVRDSAKTILAWAELPTFPTLAFEGLNEAFGHIENAKYLTGKRFL